MSKENFYSLYIVFHSIKKKMKPYIMLIKIHISKVKEIYKAYEKVSLFYPCFFMLFLTLFELICPKGSVHNGKMPSGVGDEGETVLKLLLLLLQSCLTLCDPIDGSPP